MAGGFIERRRLWLCVGLCHACGADAMHACCMCQAKAFAFTKNGIHETPQLGIQEGPCRAKRRRHDDDAQPPEQQAVTDFNLPPVCLLVLTHASHDT